MMAITPYATVIVAVARIIKCIYPVLCLLRKSSHNLPVRSKFKFICGDELLDITEFQEDLHQQLLQIWSKLLFLSDEVLTAIQPSSAISVSVFNFQTSFQYSWMQREEHVRYDWGIGHHHCKCTQCMSGCLNAVHIIQQAVNWQCCLIFREKETLPQSFTRKNTDSGQLFTFNFSLKRWRKERERLWLKKFGRGLRWTNISVNVKSAGFILKQPSIFIVICAAHFIMLVLDLARWECRAVLD